MIIIKTKQQIEGIRKSSQLAAKTLQYIEPFVVPGVTTQELNQLIEKFMRDNGAIPATLGYKGYPAASCISVNEVICHGIPGDRKLESGDIVNIDVTTILNGFYGDTSRMYAVGEISPEAKRLIETTQNALNIGIEQVKPGGRIGDIGAAIADFAESQGYSVVHAFCGHGVGLRFHEDPQVVHDSYKGTGAMMRPGMTFTIEPMLNEGVSEAVILEDNWTAVTQDRKLSAQFEHTVLVTQNGYEILTKLEG